MFKCLALLAFLSLSFLFTLTLIRFPWIFQQFLVFIGNLIESCRFFGWIFLNSFFPDLFKACMPMFVNSRIIILNLHWLGLKWCLLLLQTVFTWLYTPIHDTIVRLQHASMNLSGACIWKHAVLIRNLIANVGKCGALSPSQPRSWLVITQSWIVIGAKIVGNGTTKAVHVPLL